MKIKIESVIRDGAENEVDRFFFAAEGRNDSKVLEAFSEASSIYTMRTNNRNVILCGNHKITDCPIPGGV